MSNEVNLLLLRWSGWYGVTIQILYIGLPKFQGSLFGLMIGSPSEGKTEFIIDFMFMSFEIKHPFKK